MSDDDKNKTPKIIRTIYPSNMRPDQVDRALLGDLQREARNVSSKVIRREFVIKDKDVREIDTTPAQIPRHYCEQCRARTLPCFLCGSEAAAGAPVVMAVQYPIRAVQNGFHTGVCPAHGPIAIICGAKHIEGKAAQAITHQGKAAPPTGLVHDKYDALREQLVPHMTPAQRAAYDEANEAAREIDHGLRQSAIHDDADIDRQARALAAEKMRPAVTIGLLVGFVLGGILTALCISLFLH